MKRREFLKGALAAGATATGVAAVGGLFIPFAEAVEVPSFSFAHLSDLHLDVRGESTWQHREKSVPLFIESLRQVVRLPRLNFIVFGGDQVHYGPNDKESLVVFQQWIKQLRMPIYILLGNTEVSPINGVSGLGREDYLKAWSGNGLRPGRSSWAFDPVRGVRIIGWDVTVDGKPYGEATPEGMAWLEKELAASKDRKLVVLITHQLLLPTTERDTEPLWSIWMVRNHARVRELLNKHRNVRLVISGHHHVCRVQTEGRITYVADPATVTYPCAFRLFSISREGIHLSLVRPDDRDAVERARQLLVSDPYAKIYDPADPAKAAEFSAGLEARDREAKIRL